MKNKSLLLTSAIMIIAMSSGVAQVTGTLTDSRDGKTYKTVKIGEQTWMAENLDVKTFQNGDIITEAKTKDEWKRAGKKRIPAWCYYDNDTTNGNEYGILYNWFAVNDKRGIAPAGQHVPSNVEWAKLIKKLEADGPVGEQLKSTIGWKNNSLFKREINGTNKSGFTALPGGYRGNRTLFEGIFIDGVWWSSSESEDKEVAGFHAINMHVYSGYSYVDRKDTEKSCGLSVRCIKDQSNQRNANKVYMP